MSNLEFVDFTGQEKAIIGEEEGAVKIWISKQDNQSKLGRVELRIPLLLLLPASENGIFVVLNP